MRFLRDKELFHDLAVSKSEGQRLRKNDPDFCESHLISPGIRVTTDAERDRYIQLRIERAKQKSFAPRKPGPGRPRTQHQSEILKV
jgi:hypothetical protein